MMCGLIGIFAKNGCIPIVAFVKMMHEAQIRGQHATGIAYDSGGKLVVDKQPVSALRFIWQYTNLSYAHAIIGHTRYSTSDLEYNQPMHDETLAIVHNGVISQADPSTWEEKYKVKCETRNDSEIILRELLKAGEPLKIMDSSQAVILLQVAGPYRIFRFWRNEQRPLYYYEDEECVCVSSTKDIIHRVVGYPETNKDYVKECKPCVDYCIMADSPVIQERLIREPLEDLQHAKV